jgi:hypothetical protein
MPGEFQLNVNISNTMSSSLRRIQRQLDKLPEEAYRYFKSITPIRSGNARRNTFFNKNREEIDARYPYAQRLDEGYSKQAPQGMSKPTEKYIQQRSRKIMRKR